MTPRAVRPHVTPVISARGVSRDRSRARRLAVLHEHFRLTPQRRISRGIAEKLAEYVLADWYVPVSKHVGYQWDKGLDDMRRVDSTPHPHLHDRRGCRVYLCEVIASG